MSVNGVCVKAEGSELTVFNAVPYYSDTSTSKDPDGLQKRNLLSDTNSRSVKTAVFSPDGTRIAFLQRTRLAPAHSICMSWVLMAERSPRLRERALSTRRRYCWSGGSDSRRRSVAGRAAGWRPAACCDGTAPLSGRE